jgi:hypothetical protein
MLWSHGIAGLDGGLAAGADLIAFLHALGREDVATLAVAIKNQGDVGGAVRIVFDALHHARDAVLLATEIDDAVLLPRAAAVVTRGDAAKMIARTGAVLGDREGLIGASLVQVALADTHLEARAGRSGFEFDQRHDCVP